MHVELTEKELLSCGLPMYVCSLHEKECPCRLCSIAHVTVTRGCALQVTVSTSNSCCCPLQLFRVVAHWVAMRSWSLNCPPEHQSRKERWAAISFHVFPRQRKSLITSKSPTSTSRETTRSPTRRFAARSLLVSCPPDTMVSSYRRSSLSHLAANISGCLFGKAAHSPGFVPVWCLPEQESLESDEPPGCLLPVLRRFFGAPGSHMHTLSVSHPTGVRQRHHFFLW